MKILVRLPNWLGDMVMSVGFMHQLPQCFPGAEVSVIAKKGIHDLLPFFPPTENQFIFSKQEYKGMKGLLRFGSEIRRKENFDLFFSLPDSFSSALVGMAAGADKRVGFKKEMRQLLLTNSYKKPEGLHRAEEYVRLLELFTGKKLSSPDVRLHHQFTKQDHVVLNINSEASSRRLTVAKAVELLNALRKSTDQKIVLIGAAKESEFVEMVLSNLSNREGIESFAGKTSLHQLAEVLASAQVLLSTDSGPAHLANALGTQTIVLFGAGNESKTAPYNKEKVQVIRLGELSCEPCEKNVCVRFDTPQCLERLDVWNIVESVKNHIG